MNEYVGDLVDEEECKRRMIQAHADNITNFYMLTLDKNRSVGAMGSVSATSFSVSVSDKLANIGKACQEYIRVCQ